jgi:hypothetical protein
MVMMVLLMWLIVVAVRTRGDPWMEGSPHSQCRILPNQSFTYHISLGDQTGTYWSVAARTIIIVIIIVIIVIIIVIVVVITYATMPK